MKKFILYVFITGLFYLTACQDDPTAIGEDLIPNNDLVELISVNSTDASFNQRSYSYKDELALGNSRNLLLGSYENLKSTALLKFKFIIADSIKDSISAGKITIRDSWVKMGKIYSLGDANSAWNFDAFEITSDWKSIGFKPDSLAFVSYGSNTVTTNLVEDDSTVSFNIDKEMIGRWLDNEAKDTATINYGIILIPQTSTQKILGFNALSTVSIEDLPNLYSVIESNGNIIDTLVAYPTADTHVIEGEMTKNVQSNLVLQGGLTVKAFVWFDVTQIPQASVINSATISFYYDSLNSKIGTIKSDSILVTFLADSTTLERDSTYSSRVLTRSGEIYSGVITAFVQEWVTNPDKNHGLNFYLENYEQIANRIEILGTSATDPNKKPKLSITYTSHK